MIGTRNLIKAKHLYDCTNVPRLLGITEQLVIYHKTKYAGTYGTYILFNLNLYSNNRVYHSCTKHVPTVPTKLKLPQKSTILNLHLNLLVNLKLY